MIKVFGHRSPDTDATGSAIIAAWYYTNILKKEAEPYILGALNPETRFVLEYWNVPVPKLLEKVNPGDSVVVVDTNNADELVENLDEAQILQIVDHHRLVGNIKTGYVVDVTIRPIASTASVLAQIMADHLEALPKEIRGVMLSCVLSDTLEFRSPTTTDFDKSLAEKLAKSLDVDLHEYASKMFEAKSDVSAYSDQELVTLDSKVNEFNGKKYRIGVIETASPKVVLARKEGLMKAQKEICEKEGLAQALLFIIDILNEEAILLLPNEETKEIAKNSFDCDIKEGDDTVVLPGIVSRKKQIIPALKIQ